MARAYIMDFAGGGAEAYDRVIEDMALGGHVPPGAVFHYAGPGPDGWRVTDVWADPAAFDSFAAEQIGPISARHGFGPPRVQVVDVSMQHTGRLRRPEIVQVVRMPGLDADGFMALHEQVLEGGRWPEEIVHHVNGPSEGGWMVVDSWETRAARDAFLEARVRPAAAAVATSGPPEITDLVVHGMLSEPAAAPV